ncbi:class I SAM-dependent methyltransferase [candidate division KSB1 bacterium]
MKKIKKSLLPKDEEYIFTEGIDYFKTGKASIWGDGDKDTLELLNKTEIRGRWLNLAAGDGRYNRELLEKADHVTATDIDESALSKLWHYTPSEYRSRLETEAFDLTRGFPFNDRSFNGIFSASTLHYFPKDVLQHIFNEIDRVLDNKGKLIIEFATDIKRILPDGKLYIRSSEPQYKFKDASEFLEDLLREYKVRIIRSKVPEEEIRTRGMTFRLSCNLILLTGEKE